MGWSNEAWSASVQGRRLGKLPNDDSYYELWDPDDGTDPWIPATWRYNANVQFDITDHSRVSLTVVNLTDAKPPFDPTYTGYPYYDIAWFDREGRTFYLQYTHKFGGKPL